jgi:hypothetical protein
MFKTICMFYKLYKLPKEKYHMNIRSFTDGLLNFKAIVSKTKKKNTINKYTNFCIVDDQVRN